MALSGFKLPRSPLALMRIEVPPPYPDHLGRGLHHAGLFPADDSVAAIRQAAATRPGSHFPSRAVAGAFADSGGNIKSIAMLSAPANCERFVITMTPRLAAGSMAMNAR